MRAGYNREGLIDLANFLPLESAQMMEVGSYAGESAEIFADSMKFTRIYCVDNWKLKPEENPEGRFDTIAACRGEIVKMKGQSTSIAREFVSQVDFVYIDASHKHEAASADIAAWVKHVKPGGWIGGHDHEERFPGVIRAVREAFGGPDFTFKDYSWLVKTR